MFMPVIIGKREDNLVIRIGDKESLFPFNPDELDLSSFTDFYFALRAVKRDLVKMNGSVNEEGWDLLNEIDRRYEAVYSRVEEKFWNWWS